MKKLITFYLKFSLKNQLLTTIFALSLFFSPSLFAVDALIGQYEFTTGVDQAKPTSVATGITLSDIIIGTGLTSGTYSGDALVTSGWATSGNIGAGKKTVQFYITKDISASGFNVSKVDVTFKRSVATTGTSGKIQMNYGTTAYPTNASGIAYLSSGNVGTTAYALYSMPEGSGTGASAIPAVITATPQYLGFGPATAAATDVITIDKIEVYGTVSFTPALGTDKSSLSIKASKDHAATTPILINGANMTSTTNITLVGGNASEFTVDRSSIDATTLNGGAQTVSVTANATSSLSSRTTTLHIESAGATSVDIPVTSSCDLFFEDFFNYDNASTNTTLAGLTSLTPTNASFAQVPGWTGNKIYSFKATSPNLGTVCIGNTAADSAYLTTPAMDLSQPFKFTFKTRNLANTTIDGRYKVFLDGTQLICEGQQPTTTLTKITSPTFKGTASSKLTFTGLKVNLNNILIDSIVVNNTATPDMLNLPSNKTVSFGNVTQGTEQTVNTPIQACNLSAGLTVSLKYGTNFSLVSGATIAQATATTGTDISVKFTSPYTTGVIVDTLIIGSTGMTNRKIALNATPLIPTYVIGTSVVGNGSASGAATYNLGASVSLTATPTNGTYRFVNWTEGGTQVSTANPYSFIASVARTLVANFAAAAINISGNTNASTFASCATCDLTVASGGELTIGADKSLKSVTVAAGGKLTITAGSLTTTSGITLESDASGTATMMDSYSTPTVSATAKQYLSTARNWYFSPAVSGVTVPAESTYFGYDETGLNADLSATGATAYWKPYATGATLTAGKGYIAQPGSAATLSFNGLLNSGNVPVTLSYNADKGRGFNLVANPYPSYLSWQAVNSDADNIASANMPTGTMWYRTINYNNKNAWAPNTLYNLDDIVYNGTRFYKVITAGTSAASGGPSGITASITDNEVTWAYQGSVYIFATVNADGQVSPSIVSNLVPPMQAFWVRTTTGGGTLTFKNAMRSHNTGGSNALKAPKNTASDIKLVRLSVTNGISSDESVVYTSANALNTLDSYDAPKYFNTAATNQPEIYTQVGNEKLVINAVNEFNQGTEIPLGFASEKADNFSISIAELKNFDSEMQIILVDKNSFNTEFNLTSGQAYQFSSSAVNDANRFTVLFRAPGVTTDIVKPLKANAQVFVNAAGHITIIASEKSIYAIYNAVGQKVSEGITSANRTIVNTKHETGMYVVRVLENGKELTTRVIIK